MKAALLENMICGERIPKDKIPAEYLLKYGVNNLYHYAHPDYYRSCYTILNEGKGGFPFVIDFLNHRVYSKLFGYD